MDSKLQKKIRRADIVSFDVFDTAILRAVAQPVDVFLLMAPKVSAITGQETSSFLAARRRAEAATRDHALQRCGASEITLAEIYSTFCKMADVSEELAVPLALLEIETEQSVCRQNPFIHGLYRRCLENGKRVVFISDIYLPEYVIVSILSACGYDKYDALLVSSVAGKTKATGELFTEAHLRFSSPPEGWLHIGDNAHSDVVMARRQNMAIWHYRRCTDMYMDDRRAPLAWKNQTAKDAGHSVLVGLIANRLEHKRFFSVTSNRVKNFWQEFGYTVAGPLYASFTEWLIAQTKAQDLQALYFLARDGKVMRKIYNIVAHQAGVTVENHYLYGSRRAFNIAAIETIDDEALQFLMSGSTIMSAAQYVARTGLDWDSHIEAFHSSGFHDPHENVSDPVRRDQLRCLLIALTDQILDRAGRERKDMGEYLIQSGFRDGQRVGLIDIGWHGSMQRSIIRILNRSGVNPSVTGLYFGTFGNADLAEVRHPHDAYLFRLGQPPAMVKMITSVAIVELLFSALEGSIIRIERDFEGNFIPVRDDGDMDPYRLESIAQLQEGGMQFVKDYLVLKQKTPELNLPGELAIAPLDRVLNHPLREEARYLGDIPHIEGYGAGCAKHHIAQPPDLFTLLFQPLSFKRQLKDVYWKAGGHARVSPFHRAIYRLMGC